MTKKIFLKISIIFLTVFILCISFYFLWRNGTFLPHWIEWENKTFSSKSGKYEIHLSHKTVHINYGGALLWSTAQGIKVQDAISFDIDNDHEDELILLCWKIGRYGKQKPFWLKNDEPKWSQHIFVYEYEQEQIRPKWMSSYIGQDVARFTANNKEAPSSRLLLTDLNGITTSWVWDSWGFTKEDTDISFIVFGDNLIHEPIYRYGLQNNGSFHFLFENFKHTISQSDIAVINQETPLTDNPSHYSDYPKFGTPVQVGQAIADAGFDVVTCATNHILDKGQEGVHFTKKFFDSRQILCVGIQSMDETGYVPYEIIERNGIRFAMLNYTYGTNGMKIPDENPHMVHLLDDEEQVRNDIKAAQSDADFIILFVHWGSEYANQPDAYQKKWTQLFLESKVDVVVGTHPHALQPYELLKDNSGHEMLVYYSIGNFISAQPEKYCVKGGFANFTVSLTSSGYKITDYSLQPLVITRHGKGNFTSAPPLYHIF